MKKNKGGGKEIKPTLEREHCMQYINVSIRKHPANSGGASRESFYQL
jgi:hypothetical protein